MQKENLHYEIKPADRLANVSEYYFSRKLIAGEATISLVVRRA